MIAIITARKGSKRCPDKNIKAFNDQPNIVDITIKQAHWLNIPVILTTDYSLEELNIMDGVEFTYHKRSPYLCQEDTSSESVVKDVMDKYWNQESFVLMQPTSPIRRQETLTRAKARFDKGDIPALVSIGPNHQPNGSFYFCQTDVFLKEKTLFPKGCHFWMCSAEESVDINYPYEFRIAEAVARGDVHG